MTIFRCCLYNKQDGMTESNDAGQNCQCNKLSEYPMKVTGQK